MFSTSGDVRYIWGIQYIGGYHDYIGGYHEYIEGYHEYIERCLVHQRDIMMHVGGYHDACGEDIMMHVGGYYDACGDTKSTSGDVQYIGGYHEYSRDISYIYIMSTSGDIQYIRGIS